ncbi:MAG: hypothetical protein KC621_31640 [Myxococcales bacterium]|nr:hypothetical protein [Myxococcales bacterium]
MFPLLISSQALAVTFADGVPTLSSLEELAACVVSGVVTDSEVAHASWGVATRYDIAVERTFAGDCGEQVSVELPGGREGGLVQTYGGVPVWSVGDEVLVFVSDRSRMPLTGVFTIRDHVVIDPLSRWGSHVLFDDDLEALLAR